MPDLQAQWEPHGEYVELPVVGYTVWWRDEQGLKSSGRMPSSETDMVMRHLNRAYYPITFWRAPLYQWNRLIATAGV